MKPLNKTITEYMRSNVCVTTSGMADAAAIKFTQQVLGEERVMYAMDYPYQYIADEVRTHDLLDVPQATKIRLMQTNAERVFGL
jgi:2,3-dihydroxybenzoate decarboxylase